MTLGSIYFIAFVDLFCISLVVPFITPSFLSLGGSFLLSGVLESICAGLQFINAPLVGSWSDKSGRKKVLLYTLSLSILSNIVLGFSTSLALLILARIVNSTVHHVQVLLKAVIADQVPENEQASVFNTIGAISAAAFIIGPILGGYLYAANDFYYITIIVNSLYLLCMGSILQLKDNAPVVSKSKKSGIIENIKQIDWKTFWDIFLFRLIVELAFSLWYSVLIILLREVFKVPTESLGNMIAYISVIMIVANVVMPSTQKKYFSDDKSGILRISYAVSIQIITFLAMAFTSNFTLYLMYIIPLSFTKILLDTVCMEILLSRIKDTDKGLILGASDSIFPLAGFLSPLIRGVIVEAFSLNVTLYVPLVPLAISLPLLNNLKKVKTS